MFVVCTQFAPDMLILSNNLLHNTYRAAIFTRSFGTEHVSISRKAISRITILASTSAYALYNNLS